MDRKSDAEVCRARIQLFSWSWCHFARFRGPLCRVGGGSPTRRLLLDKVPARVVAFESHPLFGRQTTMRRATILAAFILCASPCSASEIFFTGIGDIGGGAFQSDAFAVSANGQVVVGRSGSTAISWTRNGGIQSIGGPPSGNAVAYAVSKDGEVIVGHNSTGGFRWTAATGQVGINGTSIAYAVSADGQRVAGDTASGGFVWSESTGLVSLGSGESTGISADGMVVVGTHGNQGSRWTEADGFELFGAAKGNAVSGDGIVAVGRTQPLGQLGQAFEWTQTRGLVELPGAAVFSEAYATSYHGVLIVGRFAPNGVFAQQTAFIYTATDGFRDLKSVLETDYGLSLAGWTLREATGISADGSVIVGNGTNPDGQQEGWVASIAVADVPEPSSLVLLACSGTTVLFLGRLVGHHRRNP